MACVCTHRCVVTCLFVFFPLEKHCYLCVACVSAANLSGRSVAPQDRSFVRATALLHSHFSQTQTLQEAIVRLVCVCVFVCICVCVLGEVRCRCCI